VRVAQAEFLRVAQAEFSPTEHVRTLFREPTKVLSLCNYGIPSMVTVSMVTEKVVDEFS